MANDSEAMCVMARVDPNTNWLWHTELRCVSLRGCNTLFRVFRTRA
jgi:hypothetical protein